MKPYWWSVGGLIFDILGGAFLSVEAIKVKNVRKLRDRYLRSFAQGIKARMFRPDGPLTPEIIEDARSRAFGGHHKLHSALHWVAGGLVFVALELLAHRFGFEPTRWMAVHIWQLPVVGRIPVIILALVVCWGLLWGLGEIVHKSSERALGLAISGLEAIERNTATGGIGVIGFVLLLLGFLGQMVGTILSAK